jgi:hypothetical protein
LLQQYGRILAMASSDPPSGRDREVFASLPNARPSRRSAKRDGAAGGRGAGGTARAPGKPRAKPAPKAKQGAPRSTAKRSTARAKPAPKASRIPPAGYATPPANDDDGPKGADLVTTAVQAVGELAQIGIAAGGRALKSALQRLPRP